MKTKLTTSLLGFLLIIVVWSCRKELGFDEENVEVPADFWAYNPQTTKGQTASDGGVRKLTPRAIKDLQKMKKTKAFESYVSALGRPAWNKSSEFSNPNKIKNLIVPIINDDKESVTALLVVNYMDPYFKYHVVTRGKYPRTMGKNRGKNLMPKEGWDRMFSAMDKEFYNKGKSKGFVKKSGENAIVKDYEQYEYIGWICWYWCYVDQYDDCIPGTETEWQCADLYDWVWYDDEDQPINSEEDWNIAGGGGETLVTESAPPAEHRLPNTQKLPVAFGGNVQEREGFCVPKVLQYASTYFDGTSTSYPIMDYYVDSILHKGNKRDSIYTAGVQPALISDLIDHFFYKGNTNLTSQSAMADAIDNGHPLVGTIQINGRYHELFITGYDDGIGSNNRIFEAFDPQLTIYRPVEPGQLGLVYELTGKK